MRRVCEHSGKSYEITDADLAFYSKVSPRIDGKTFTIPPPRLSPQSRLQRRLAFINQLYVYTRSSSITGKSIFSMFPEKVPFPVYENEEWLGAGRDGMS